MPPAFVPNERELILSGLSPGPAQKRLALALVAGILAVFLSITAGPLKGVATKPVAAFVPAYATAMFLCDSITAILLFTQFSILRSRAILVIASGYLFAALILIPWILTFPDVFVAGGLVGGLQSTSWLYFAQHAGFSLFVTGYALMKDRNPATDVWPREMLPAVTASVGLTVALVVGSAFVCIADERFLPRVVLDSLHLSPVWPYVGAPVALSSGSALVALWFRRRSMLDLWLMVVMSLYTIEVPLSYYPTPMRFSIGWYAVRVLGFVASTLVLIVLLYEIRELYGKLFGAMLGQRREREARLVTGDAVAATIAHEVRQPLTAMITSADAGFRFLDRAAPNLEKAKQAFRRISADGHRAGEVVGSIRAVFRNDAGTRTPLDLNVVIRDVLALETNDLRKHRIEVQVEPCGDLPEVQGDRVQLQQVLLNLITNAIQAMTAEDERRVLCVKSTTHEGDRVLVSVADTGAGIGAQDVGRVFSPLFTTKSDGMGMGLSICRAIIEAHEGRLWVVPNTPRGSIFSFSLQANRSILPAP